MSQHNKESAPRDDGDSVGDEDVEEHFDSRKTYGVPELGDMETHSEFLERFEREWEGLDENGNPITPPPGTPPPDAPHPGSRA